MNLGQIRTQVRNYANEQSTARFSDAFVNELINGTQAIIAAELGWKSVPTAIAVTASSQTFSLPSDMMPGGIVSAWWDNDPIAVVTVDEQTWNEDDWIPDASSGTPERVVVVGVTGYLNPTPSAAGSVRFLQIPGLTDLSADVDTPTLPTVVHRWLAIRTAITVCELAGRPDDAQALRGVYQQLAGPHVIDKANEGSPQVRDIWS